MAKERKRVKMGVRKEESQERKEGRNEKRNCKRE